MSTAVLSVSDRLSAARAYVRDLLRDDLSPDLVFHNLLHTENVIKASRELCENLNVPAKEMNCVLLAACFHDVGYAYAYHGHEEKSCEIAFDYLTGTGCDGEDISTVLRCIRATQMPQNPDCLLARILCDADMSHLASKNYLQRADKLRKEWQKVKDFDIDDDNWYHQNIAFMEHHRYFTTYARKVWGKRKEKNIRTLREMI